MSRKSNLVILVSMLAGIAILMSLGTWQVRRLAWKENLIATVEGRMASSPVPVTEALQLSASSGEGNDALDYRPVVISGTYLDSPPVFEFTTYKGQSGWNIFNVLKLAGAEGQENPYTLINRGFIPYDRRAGWHEIAALPEGEQQITGLLRHALTEKPGSMLPDNEPENRTFYWRDVTAMATLSGIANGQLAAWYVDEGLPDTQKESRLPLTGTTIVSFPNNHLQYAITWYGLALALLGVGSYFLYSRRRKRG